MRERMTLQHFLTGKTVWQSGRTYTLMHRYSNVDRKTACCQDRVFIYCFPSVSVHAPWGTDKHTHTSIVLYIVLYVFLLAWQPQHASYAIKQQ